MEQTGGFSGPHQEGNLGIDPEKNKPKRSLGGIRDMAKVPSAIWAVDTNKHIAAGVRPATKPGQCDPNCDPRGRLPNPGNDDADPPGRAPGDRFRGRRGCRSVPDQRSTRF